MRKNLFSLWAFFFSLLSFTISGQGEDFRYEALKLEDGLSQSSVSTITQDEAGFLWVGTMDGLNRYDGHTFKVFKNRPFDSSSLSSNHINDLLSSSSGGIWVGTYSGLNYFDPSTGIFRRYQHDQNDRQSISNDIITCLFLEGDSVLWAGSSNGLNKLRLSDSEKVNPQISVSTFLVDRSKIRRAGLSAHHILSIFRDSKGFLWVGTTKGVYRFDFKKDPEGNTPLYYGMDYDQKGSLKAWQVTSIAEDEYGHIWIGTYAGLHRFQNESEGFLEPDSVLKQLDGDKPAEIMSIEPYKEGKFLIGTYMGPAIGHPDDKGQIRLEMKSPGSNESVASLVAFADRLNPDLIWVGTEMNGLMKYYLKPSRFASNHLDGALKAGLYSPSIFGLAKDANNVIWMGSPLGILAYDPSKESYNFFRFNPDSENGLKGRAVSDLFIDSKNNLWVSTAVGPHRLTKFDGEQAEFKYYYKDRKSADMAAFGMYEDPSGYLIYGTYTGINIYDYSSDSILNDPIVIDTVALTLRGYRVNSIVKDSQNDLWIGSSNGLYRIKDVINLPTDLVTEKVESFRYNERDTNSIRNDFIASLLVDSKDRLWAGTFNGLIRIMTDGSTVSFKSYSEEDGLSNNVVYEILEEQETGRLWLSTNRGLSRFDPETEEFWVFTSADGLQSNEFNMNAAFASPDGELLFGGVNGLTRFDPKTIIEDENLPPVHFMYLKPLKGERIDLLDGKIGAIQLKPGQSSFEVHFMGLDFAAPQQVKYAYTFDKKNENWIPLGNDQKINFARLSPGFHTLRVRAANRDGVWNPNDAKLFIHLQAPFWRTPWFWGILVLLVGVIALVLHRFRWQMKMKKLQEIDAFRKSTAEDFHDELGSKLTIISLFSEITREKLDENDQKVKPYLNKVIDTSNSLYHSMKDLIWALNPEQDTIYDLALQIKDFGDELFHDTGIEFLTDGLDGAFVSQELPMSLKRHILLVFKEAMNNVLKHSECRQVKMSLYNGNNVLKIQLEDNGKGFFYKNEESGEGLKNMASRAERINARLTVNSNPGKGTQILLECPLPN